MGFFDFIKSGVGILKNVIGEHSGLVHKLESLAGVVASAIPVVGPIIGNAVPALSAIFSDDSAPQSAATSTPVPGLSKDDLNQAFTTNLRRSTDEITTVIHESAEKVKRALDHKLDELAKKTELTHQVEQFKTIKWGISDRITWFNDNKKLFDVSAESDPEQIKHILVHPDSTVTLAKSREILFGHIATVAHILTDNSTKPFQDLLDLYLVAVHWLLIYDKALIVIQGLLAQSLFVRSQYGQYLRTVDDVYESIDTLRKDSSNAQYTIKVVLETLPDIRFAAITVVYEDKKLRLDDRWPEISIGRFDRANAEKLVPSGQLIKALEKEDDETRNNAKKELDESIPATLYKTIVQQSLHVSLQPAAAVMESLGNSLKHWNSRLPANPIKFIHARYHVEPSKKVFFQDRNQSDSKFQYWEKQVLYSCTYVNKFGEGKESDSHPNPVFLTKGIKRIQLTLLPIQFSGDPTADLEPITLANKSHPPGRGIYRRIYASYIMSPEKVIKELVAEVPEDTMTYDHHLKGSSEESGKHDLPEEIDAGDVVAL